MDKIEENEEFDMLENELSEFKNQLGNSFNERMINMIEICKYECGINIDNKKNKSRQKLLRYIKEYQKYGHNNFIRNHKKKHFTKNKLL